MELAPASRPDTAVRRPRVLLAADLGALAALSLLAICAGLLLNASRRDPLPLRYTSAEARLQAVVAALAAGHPARVPVEQIGLPSFQRLVAGGKVLILDARPDLFYREGHVPGALNLARASFGADFGRVRERLEAARDSQVVVYCADADCPDSGLVAAALQELGWRQVADFAPGWDGWTAAGLPTAKDPSPP